MSNFDVLQDYPQKQDFGTIDPLTFLLWPFLKLGINETN